MYPAITPSITDDRYRSPWINIVVDTRPLDERWHNALRKLEETMLAVAERFKTFTAIAGGYSWSVKTWLPGDEPEPAELDFWERPPHITFGPQNWALGRTTEAPAGVIRTVYRLWHIATAPDYPLPKFPAPDLSKYDQPTNHGPQRRSHARRDTIAHQTRNTVTHRCAHPTPRRHRPTHRTR